MVDVKRASLDLYAIFALTLLLDLVLLLAPDATVPRVVLGLAFALFAPGYVSLALLFPSRLPSSRRGLMRLERFALSVGISVAIVPLLGLLLNLTPFGVRIGPMVVALSAFVLVMGLLALWRRTALPEAERDRPTVLGSLPARWSSLAMRDRAFVAAIVLAVLLSIAGWSYAVATRSAGETFTEFYVVGPDGTSQAYPTVLSAGETANLTLGVRSHEASATEYEVRPRLIGVVYDEAPNGVRTPREVNATDLPKLTFTLEPGAAQTSPLSVTLPTDGSYELALDLYRAGDTSPYRALHLWFNAPNVPIG